MLFTPVIIICGTCIIFQITRSLARHWRALAETAFLAVSTFLGGGHDGFGFALCVIILIHIFRFVRNGIRKAEERKARHIRKKLFR